MDFKSIGQQIAESLPPQTGESEEIASDINPGIAYWASRGPNGLTMTVRAAGVYGPAYYSLRYNEGEEENVLIAIDQWARDQLS